MQDFPVNNFNKSMIKISQLWTENNLDIKNKNFTEKKKIIRFQNDHWLCKALWTKLKKFSQAKRKNKKIIRKNMNGF